MNLYASDETNDLEAQGAYLNYRVGEPMITRKTIMMILKSVLYT